MRKHSYSFVRAERRRWGLTQAEVAALLGVESATTVSRIERAVRQPTAATVIAYSVLFGLPVSELFVSLHDRIEGEVFVAARRLHDTLEDEGGSGSRRKRDFLEQVLARSIVPNH